MSESWPKVLVTAIGAPLVLLGLSTLLIPGIIEESNKTEALRVARLKKTLEIADRNREFKSRLNVLKTRMHTFNQQNVRGHLSRAELRDVKKRFQQEHTNDYLELDKMAWWWYWDLEREGEIFGLLSSPELITLHDLLEKYGNNTAESAGTISALWEFLSSSKYSLSKESQKRITDLELEMNTRLTDLSKVREDLVKAMEASFAQSQHIPPKARTTP